MTELKKKATFPGYLTRRALTVTHVYAVSDLRPIPQYGEGFWLYPVCESMEPITVSRKEVVGFGPLYAEAFDAWMWIEDQGGRPCRGCLLRAHQWAGAETPTPADSQPG